MINSNKEIAVSFLRLAAKGNVSEAYSKHIGPGFRHHNPFLEGSGEALMEAMEESVHQNPNQVLEVKQVIAEGDLVVVHSHVRQNPDDLGGAVVHIFRFENGHIAELWDIGQAIPTDSPNENEMF
ncbi:MAG: nuclear transport factor 2 family protein [Methanolobus sp.]|nr:nuclear transport factor 2 family protein [Methanolobus sp.]